MSVLQKIEEANKWISVEGEGHLPSTKYPLNLTRKEWQELASICAMIEERDKRINRLRSYIKQLEREKPWNITKRGWQQMRKELRTKMVARGDLRK